MQTIKEKLTVCAPCADDAVITLTLGELRALATDAQALADVRTLNEWLEGPDSLEWYVQKCAELDGTVVYKVVTVFVLGGGQCGRDFLTPDGKAYMTPEAAIAAAAAWVRGQKP